MTSQSRYCAEYQSTRSSVVKTPDTHPESQYGLQGAMGGLGVHAATEKCSPGGSGVHAAAEKCSPKWVRGACSHREKRSPGEW